MKQLLSDIDSELSVIERAVILNHLGLDGERGIPVSEISESLNMECSLIGCIEKTAVRKLNRPLRVILPDAQESNEAVIERHRRRNRFFELFDGLSLREQKVVWYRFGVIDGKYHSVVETAAVFGIRPERVRQIQNKPFRRMHFPRKNKLTDFQVY